MSTTKQKKKVVARRRRRTPSLPPEERSEYECDACSVPCQRAAYTQTQWTRAVKGNKHTCKACERNARWLKKYGKTYDELHKMLSDQEFACRICGKALELGTNTHIDHDHDTGAVRGILCPPCNVGLGHFKDRAASCIFAALYLIETATPNSDKLHKHIMMEVHRAFRFLGDELRFNCEDWISIED